MIEAYIVAAQRTAGGRRKGALAGLGAVVLDALVDRSGVYPAAIDDVIVGCVSQAGEQPSLSAATWCSCRSCLTAFLPSPSTVNADRRNMHCNSLHRP